MTQLSTRAEAIRARDDDSFEVWDGPPVEAAEGEEGSAAPAAGSGTTQTTVKQTPLRNWETGVNSEYGVPRVNEKGERYGHGGLDIKGKTGDPVLSTMDGYVLKNGDMGNKGYGKYTLVDHGGGVITRYAHLSTHKAGEGQRVKKGELIGAVGSTGRSTGAHLHYEIKVNGKSVNPKTFKQHDVVTGGGGHGGGVATQSGRSFNLVKTIEKIEKSGLPEVAKQARITRAREKASRFDYQEAKTTEAINDEIYTVINSLPSPEDFQNTDQLPAATLFKMRGNPKLTAYWRAQAESNKQTVEARARQNNREARGELAEQARADMGWMMLSAPEKFMGINFRQDIPGLTSADRLNMEETRLKMIDGQKNPAEAVGYSPLRETLNRMLPKDYEKTPAGRANAAAVYEKIVQLEAAEVKRNKGEAINQGVRDAIVARQVMEVRLTSDGSKTLRGALRDGQTAKAPSRDVVRTQLKQRNRGVDPTEAEVTRAMDYIKAAGR